MAPCPRGRSVLNRIDPAPSPWAARQGARQQLEQIYERGLFGSAAAPPPGTLRGIDVMEHGEVAQKLSRANRILVGRYGRLADFLAPRGFFEKLTLAKFFAPVPMPSPADKLGVAQYIPPRLRPRVGPVPVLWSGCAPVTNATLEAAGARAGASYFVKSNAATKQHQRILFPMSNDEETALAERCARWLGGRHGTRAGEWYYWVIRNRVMVEEDIGKDGRAPTDWKFHCFGGKVGIVQLDFDRDADHVQVAHDRDLAPLDHELYFRTGPTISPPANYATLIECAEAIAAPFEYARVDLYNEPGGVFLGEITLAPFGGLRPARSETLDALMGRLWQTAMFEKDG